MERVQDGERERNGAAEEQSVSYPIDERERRPPREKSGAVQQRRNPSESEQRSERRVRGGNQNRNSLAFQKMVVPGVGCRPCRSTL